MTPRLPGSLVPAAFVAALLGTAGSAVAAPPDSVRRLEVAVVLFSRSFTRTPTRAEIERALAVRAGRAHLAAGGHGAPRVRGRAPGVTACRR